jgi:Flp pilus assembly protein TadG
MLSILRSFLARRPSRVRRRGDRHGLEALGDRAGQALAEFVLVIPVLLLLVFGIVEFGLAFRTHQIVTNSAREGARVAVLPSATEQRVIDVVEDRLQSSGLDPSLADITMFCVDDDDGTETEGWCAPADRFGNLTRVVVGYPYTFFVLGGLVAWACGDDCASQYGTIDLRTASAMRNE